jgi:hypothetical protein
VRVGGKLVVVDEADPPGTLILSPCLRSMVRT